MKNRLPHTPQTRIPITKILGFMLMLAGFITIPDQILHYLLVLAHTIYESAEFLFEGILEHSLGVGKAHSQAIFFYLTVGAGILTMYWLLRRLPTLFQRLKATCLEQYALIRIQAIQAWQGLPTNQKVTLLLIQCAGLFGGLALLLS
jgi:hypothetical protein